jgi:hypothetical protein
MLHSVGLSDCVFHIGVERNGYKTEIMRISGNLESNVRLNNDVIVRDVGRFIYSGSVANLEAEMDG